MFYVISSLDDLLFLQNALAKFARWCNLMGLTINTQKCKVMTFHRTREIKFDSFPLVRVIEVKDLEFIYVPLLDFRPHIDFIV